MDRLLKISFDASTYESAKRRVDYICAQTDDNGFDVTITMVAVALNTMHDLLPAAYPTLDLQRQLLGYIALMAAKAQSGEMAQQTYPYDLPCEIEDLHL